MAENQDLWLGTHCRQLAFILPPSTDGAGPPLKDKFNSLCLLPSSIAPDTGGGMMSINIFKLRHVTHCSPSLCAVFEMPRFIHSGPVRLWD